MHFRHLSTYQKLKTPKKNKPKTHQVRDRRSKFGLEIQERKSLYPPVLSHTAWIWAQTLATGNGRNKDLQPQIKKNIAVMSSTKQTQPLSAQSPAFYLVYQDQNVWVFFRFLGPAVLLEEQDPVWYSPGCVGTDTLGAEEHQCVAVCPGGVKHLQERSAMLI